MLKVRRNEAALNEIRLSPEGRVVQICGSPPSTNSSIPVI
jgi:hypothetical protein